MKFKLEPSHRDIPDKELLGALVRVANELRKDKVND